MNDIGNGVVNIKEMQAEITRLLALAVRVRKIEWVTEFAGRVGELEIVVGVDRFSIITKRGERIEVRYNQGLGPFPSPDEAKAACQSALEAWVGQFVEVGE